MLLTFELYEDGCNRPKVHINPVMVASVQEWKNRQVSTVLLTAGEKYSVVDYNGEVAKQISEAQSLERLLSRPVSGYSGGSR